MCEWHRIKVEDISKGGDSMSSVNDAVNSITNLFESGDIRLVVDIALIAMVVWFVIRGVNRLFETLVLGGITVYAVYHILQYLGIEVDYQNLLSQLSYYLQQLITYVNNCLPR
jgi:hypothetical protein